MKIAIDARSVTLHQGTGIGTYTNNILSELLSLPSSNEYTLFCCSKFNSIYNLPHSNIIFSSGKHSTFYEKYYIPKKLNEMHTDLYHIPQNGLGFPMDNSIKTIVTIHDLIPYIMPETVGKGYLDRFLREMPSIIENAAGILTVSEYSKQDILKFFKCCPEEKVFVTPLAANSRYKPLNKDKCKTIINNKYNFSCDYILYLGGFSSRKNVLGLIKAFAKIKQDLDKPCKLLLGGSLKDDGEKLLSYTIENNLSDQVIFCGYLEDELLPIIYNGAEAFVYPSLYEGFGLPPLEAMSCKVPVITSNLTSIPEVTSDSAILINPYNEYELSKEIVNLLNNNNLKTNLSEKGYNRSLDFNWHNTALSTFSCYEQIFNICY